MAVGFRKETKDSLQRLFSKCRHHAPLVRCHKNIPNFGLSSFKKSQLERAALESRELEGSELLNNLCSFPAYGPK